MDTGRRIVLVESGMALSWIALGVLFGGAAAVDWWWLGSVLALGIVVTSWAGDRGVGDGWATVVAVTAFGVAIFAVGLSRGPDLVADAVIPVSLVGIGAGLFVYRIYFGVVRPVPEERVRRAGDRRA